MGDFSRGRTGRKNAVGLFSALCDFHDELLNGYSFKNSLIAFSKSIETKEKKTPHFNVQAKKQDLIELVKQHTSGKLHLTFDQVSQTLKALEEYEVIKFKVALETGQRVKNFDVLRKYGGDRRTENINCLIKTWNKNSPSLDDNDGVIPSSPSEEDQNNISDDIDIGNSIIGQDAIWISRIKSFQSKSYHFDITSNRLKEDFQWDKLPLVDLGLVKPRQQSRNIVDRVSKDNSEDDNIKDEVAKKYEHQAFMEEVLKQSKTPKGQGKSIIIGEPGAGKSTLLQQIHRIILDRSWGYPIWISLKELDTISQAKDGEKLLSSIYNKWLSDVLKTSFLTTSGKKRIEEEKESLKALFLDETKKIWLLLDGLDEMKVKGVQSSFSAIQKQIDNLKELSPYRVVLTCRQNLWNSYDKNDLRGFDAFYIQKFNPSQVKQFIKNWFSLASKTESGYELIQKLANSKNQNLRYLVSNPLLLTMLCIIYERADVEKEVTLPETRANLYNEFIPHYYSWKKKEFNIFEHHRNRIEDDILPKIALWNFENSSSLYLFPEDELKRFLKEEFSWSQIELNSWLTRLENTWLQRVGFTKEDTTQAAYCFFHLTFQEYFAAKGIDDRDFFLPRNHLDKPLEGKEYRIFNSAWYEVILFWIGRNDIKKGEREEFINKLILLKCDSQDLIHYRALMLAATFIVEIPNYSIILKKRIQDELSFCCQFNQYLDTDIALINNEVSHEVLIDLLSSNETTWQVQYIIQNQNSNTDFLNRLLPLLDLEIYERDVCGCTGEIISAAKNQDCNEKIISLIEQEVIDGKSNNIEQISIYLYALQGVSKEPQALQKLLPTLKSLLSKKGHRLQVEIIDILGQTDDSEINKIIYPYLEKEKGEYREYALYALRKTSNWQYISKIIHIIHQNHPLYRNDAIDVVHNILIENKNTRLARKIIRLVKVLLKDQDPQVRASAIDVLSGMEDKPTLEKIIAEFINDTEAVYREKDILSKNAIVTTYSVPVRTAAIKALKEVNNWAVVENQVIPILKSSNNRYVIRASMLCISGIKDKQRLEKVLKQEVIPCFKHRDVYVWGYIFDCLKDTGNIDLLVPLLDKLDEDMCAFNAKDLEYIGSSLIRHLRYIKEKENAVTVIRYLTSNRSASFACKTSTKMATLYHCIKQLSYAEAYNAINYREILEDTQLQTEILILSSTNYVFPLLIETPELVNECDYAIISQEIINKIYDSYQTELGEYLKETVPDIQNWSKLKTEVLDIKRKLPQKSLAFVIRNCDPTPELIYILEKLTDTVDICWITNKKVNSATITGISSESSYLQNAIDNWLKKLNDIFKQQ